MLPRVSSVRFYSGASSWFAWLEACPQCEAIPVVAGAVCQNIVSKIIEDNLDLLDGNSRTQAAKLFCEAEGLCAT